METSGTTSISQLPGNNLPNSYDQPLQTQTNTNNCCIKSSQQYFSWTK